MPNRRLSKAKFIFTKDNDIFERKNRAVRTLGKIVVARSNENPTDTCKITLPRKIKWKDEVGTPVKCGDKVLVKLSYNELQTAFRGYITKISAKDPLVAGNSPLEVLGSFPE